MVTSKQIEQAKQQANSILVGSELRLEMEKALITIIQLYDLGTFGPHVQQLIKWSKEERRKEKLKETWRNFLRWRHK